MDSDTRIAALASSGVFVANESSVFCEVNVAGTSSFIIPPLSARFVQPIKPETAVDMVDQLPLCGSMKLNITLSGRLRTAGDGDGPAKLLARFPSIVFDGSAAPPGGIWYVVLESYLPNIAASVAPAPGGVAGASAAGLPEPPRLDATPLFSLHKLAPPVPPGPAQRDRLLAALRGERALRALQAHGANSFQALGVTSDVARLADADVTEAAMAALSGISAASPLLRRGVSADERTAGLSLGALGILLLREGVEAVAARSPAASGTGAAEVAEALTAGVAGAAATRSTSVWPSGPVLLPEWAALRPQPAAAAAAPAAPALATAASTAAAPATPDTTSKVVASPGSASGAGGSATAVQLLDAPGSGIAVVHVESGAAGASARVREAGSLTAAIMAAEQSAAAAADAAAAAADAAAAAAAAVNPAPSTTPTHTPSTPAPATTLVSWIPGAFGFGRSPAVAAPLPRIPLPEERERDAAEAAIVASAAAAAAALAADAAVLASAARERAEELAQLRRMADEAAAAQAAAEVDAALRQAEADARSATLADQDRRDGLAHEVDVSRRARACGGMGRDALCQCGAN